MHVYAQYMSGSQLYSGAADFGPRIDHILLCICINISIWIGFRLWVNDCFGSSCERLFVCKEIFHTAFSCIQNLIVSTWIFQNWIEAIGKSLCWIKLWTALKIRYIVYSISCIQNWIVSNGSFQKCVEAMSKQSCKTTRRLNHAVPGAERV